MTSQSVSVTQHTCRCACFVICSNVIDTRDIELRGPSVAEGGGGGTKVSTLIFSVITPEPFELEVETAETQPSWRPIQARPYDT